MATAVVAAGATPSQADQSPAGCSSNSLALTVTKDKTLVRNGDTARYTVTVANDAGAACDLTSATVTLTLPAADGTPAGAEVTLASNADYPAGTAPLVLGTVPYKVAVNPGVTDAVVKARATGTLHDAPSDHAADISKTLGTTVSQPHVTLSKAATPPAGEAPVAVTYTYTLTNDSSTAVPVSGATVSDDRCSPVAFTGGDADGNARLDVGEAWTFACSHTFDTGGTFTNVATATATSTVDGLPVAVDPAQSTVTVAPPPRSEVLGHELPSTHSPHAHAGAACISVPPRLSLRARELAVVRVRVVEQQGRSPENALVRISGPGFARRATTDGQGAVVFRVRPRRSGTVVIQSDRCSGADRIPVRAARSVISRRVPRTTG